MKRREKNGTRSSLTDPPGRELHLSVQASLLPSFCPLLQQGVGVKVSTAMSVRAFLRDELGLSPEYVETRIQTVFLDGKAVDDLDLASVRDGSILSLSAAMPGLLGATLRRGSYYAAMRSEISHHGESEATPGNGGTVSVKLFNLLVNEVGPLLLAKGIRLPGTDLLDFLQRQSPRFWSACVKALLGGHDLDPMEISRMDWTEAPLLLRVLPVDQDPLADC